jgi:hypothetical protein
MHVIQDHRVTASIVAPPVALALARHPMVDNFDLSSLRVSGLGRGCIELDAVDLAPAPPQRRGQIPLRAADVEDDRTVGNRGQQELVRRRQAAAGDEVSVRAHRDGILGAAPSLRTG